MEESLELFALVIAVGAFGIGITLLLVAKQQKSTQIQKAAFVLLVIGGMLLISGKGYLYTSGFLRVPPPPLTAAQIQERQEAEKWQKEKEEQERKANSPERLKQLESEKKWVGTCCDAAGVEMKQYLKTLDLAQDVTVSTIDYGVTKDDDVGVKIYLIYNNVALQANKDFQEKLRQQFELMVLNKLLVKFKRSQIMIGFDENKGNWDK